MKISLNWLKDYILLKEGNEEIGQVLTDTGLEVEGIEAFEEVPGGMEGIVIGEVIECKKHPDADKLRITKVDIGTDELVPIVCGAPNVAAGQKVVVATVGAVLYPSSGESFKIKKAKIRGELSAGMICAEDEIGLGTSHDGIIVLDTDLSNGTPAADYFKPAHDTIYEIGLTPNRADGASHFGVARDLRAAYDRPLQFPDLSGFKVDNTNNPVEVVIENPGACPRFSGVTMTNLKIKESPTWLKNRLKSIGLTPVNNVVDATNYVLHALGQPLHAYDLDEVKGNKIIVKNLPHGTSFVTLDNQERKLLAEDLMVCNESEGMCIAGVFGGAQSGVKETTQDIFLESAYFSADCVRKTAMKHGLKTDASFRFERGTDPNMTVNALKYAALLIKETANGVVSSDIVDIYSKPIEHFQVDVAYSNVDRLIGEKIPHQRIKEILVNLDIGIIEESDDCIRVSVPPYRVDVTREADVIEEILRIYGYNNIQLEESYGTAYLANFPNPDKDKIQEKTGLFLSANGLSEIFSNSLTNPLYVEKSDFLESAQNVEVLNKLSEELGVLRQTMVFSMLEAMRYNINRKQQNLKFFEFGKVYYKEAEKYCQSDLLTIGLTGLKSEESWVVDKKSIDFHDVSLLAHKLLDKFSVAKFDSFPTTNAMFEFGLDISANDSLLASFGKLNKKVTAQIEVNQEVFFAEFYWSKLLKQYGKKIQYREVSKFPEVRRDLSLVLNKEISFGEIMALTQKEGKKLIKNVNVFNVYEGENIGKDKKSYALSFILQDENRTLNDKVIDKVMNALINSFENNLKAIIRK